MKHLLSFVICLLTVGSLSAQTKDHTYIVNSKCYLIVPKGFTASTFRSAILNSRGNAGINIIRVNSTLAEFGKLFHFDTLKKKKAVLIETKDMKIGKYNGKFYKTYQESQKSFKEVYAFEEEGKCISLNAFYPESNKLMSDTLRASIQSVIYDKNHKDVVSESARFEIDLDQNKFKLAKNIYDNLIYSKTGLLNKESYEEPTALIGFVKYPKPVSDKKQFTKDKYSKNAKMTEMNVSEPMPLKIDGMEGYECTVNGVNSRGKKEYHYNVCLFAEDGFYTIKFITQNENDLKSYPSMAKTFKRK